MQTLQWENQSSLDLFRQCYQIEPTLRITAPGRVNLIGEHTDYNQLPVMPMPLTRHVTIYAAPNDDGVVRLHNADIDFPAVEIRLSDEIKPAEPRWGNYCRAAVKSAMSFVDSPSGPIGFDAVVFSDLPAAAGLSSSSALVIATCATFLQINGMNWSTSEVADRMRVAEQFVGTAGGGMDQAVIAMGEQGSALIIEFDPLKTKSVLIPEDLHVFVINSGQKAEKTGNARFFYNRRSLECAIGVELLRKSAGERRLSPAWTSLRDVYEDCKSEPELSWQELVLQSLSPEPYTQNQLVDLLGVELMNELCRSRQLTLDNISEWLPNGQFQIYPRVAHVMGEADRVYAFGVAVEAQDFPGIYHNANASHASCRDLYHISTEAIEGLIAKAMAAGAGAARITGAGFGGCVVAFVAAQNAESFVSQLVELGVPANSILEAKSQGGVQVENLM